MTNHPHPVEGQALAERLREWQEARRHTAMTGNGSYRFGLAEMLLDEAVPEILAALRSSSEQHRGEGGELSAWLREYANDIWISDEARLNLNKAADLLAAADTPAPEPERSPEEIAKTIVDQHEAGWEMFANAIIEEPEEAREELEEWIADAIRDLQSALRSANQAREKAEEELRRAAETLLRFAMVGKLGEFYVEEAMPEPTFPVEGTKLDPDGPSPVTLTGDDFSKALRTWKRLTAKAALAHKTEGG